MQSGCWKFRLTPRRRNPFAETGAASSFKRQIEDYSAGFTDLPGVDHLGEITPFQRQVLEFALAKEEEEKQKRQEEIKQEAQGGGGHNTPPKNPRAGGGASSNTHNLGGEETVRYVNEQEYPNHEVHD